MRWLTKLVTMRCIPIAVRDRFVSRNRGTPPVRNVAKYLRSSVASNMHASSSILSLTPSSEAPSLSLLFSLFLGLPVVLWTYKCLMMVIFQRKIIYMGYIPPGSRQEKLSDIPNLTRLQQNFDLEEAQIQSSDKAKLSTLIMSKKGTQRPHCITLYLQGNAGNPLHRIPVFTSLLSSTSIDPIVLAPAPRSYWTSTNLTPTQGGILADYTSTIQYAVKRWPGTPIVLYGHSLGGSIAVSLLSSLDEVLILEGRAKEKSQELRSALKGLILENPFSSVPDMVRALYPQRWLPYRYLAPLTWDKWDALAAMRTSISSLRVPTAESGSNGALPYLAQNMLILVSSRDELVPPSMGHSIFNERPLGGVQNGKKGNWKDGARLVEIDGALHEDAWRRLQWKKEIGSYLEKVGRAEK